MVEAIIFQFFLVFHDALPFNSIGDLMANFSLFNLLLILHDFRVEFTDPMDATTFVCT